MGTGILTNLTAEGSPQDIDHMLSFISNGKNVLDQGKLESLTNCKLTLKIDTSPGILFSPYTLEDGEEKVKRQRALLICDNWWYSNDIDTKFLNLLSSFFPKLIWKIYYDNYQWSATCCVYKYGFETHVITLRDDDYLEFSLVDPDDEYETPLNSEMDLVGLKNKLDQMYLENIGEVKNLKTVVDLIRSIILDDAIDQCSLTSNPKTSNALITIVVKKYKDQIADIDEDEFFSVNEAYKLIDI